MRKLSHFVCLTPFSENWFGANAVCAARSSSSDSPSVDTSQDGLPPPEPLDMLAVDVGAWEVLYSAGLDYYQE